MVPFKHIDGSLYTQVGGMSMGSRLSPLFSNFYMAHLENTILDSINRDKRPLVYCRYVDDIFLIDDIFRLCVSATTHAQNGSIKHHHQSQHSQKIRAKDIEDRMTTIFRSPSKIDLTIAEALHIKIDAPSLNNQREGDTRILKIF